jgi:hypothetical protein
MHLMSKLLALGLLAVLAAALTAPTASFAHERRTIGGGKYDVVVGWDVEPAYESMKNAASIRITRAGSNPAEPVTGAERTLKIQLRQGATTREFPLRAVFGQPGYYVADLMPNRVGDYQFTFVGAIGDDQVNERFDSADGKFDGVKSTAELQFPVALGDPAQVAADMRAEAQSARTLGMVGIVVGALGLLAALGAWAMRPKATAAGAASR